MPDLSFGDVHIDTINIYIDECCGDNSENTDDSTSGETESTDDSHKPTNKSK